MKLCLSSLQHTDFWKQNDYALPQYDVGAMRAVTLEHTAWLHFGAGNIFRSFIAAAQQTLLNKGLCSHGIVVCEGFDEELIEKAYRPYENLSVLVLLHADGRMEKRIVASVADSWAASASTEKLQNVFSSPDLQMVSLTITEKGYALHGAGGEILPQVAAELKAGPMQVKTLMGQVAALCLHRFKNGAHPLALVSMDNCSHNGARLHEAVRTFAEHWERAELAPEGFTAYMDDPSRVSFPWTMIDKITPRPDGQVADMLKEDGLEDMETIITGKNTYTAAYVNAEAPEYLVVEDLFPNGRPPLEKAGIYMADRVTVDKVEKMKVCTCLNPLHTGLAVFGCLLGFESIAQEMLDFHLRSLAVQLGHEDGLPVVTDPGIIRPEDFLQEVLSQRLSNPYLPDTPQRIATDTSQKLAIRFGETIKAWKNTPQGTGAIRHIPLIFAGWLRYLCGVDDHLQPFALSPDPMLPELTAQLDGLKPGADASLCAEKIHPLLRDARIFGVDLQEAGLAKQVEDYFIRMMSGDGAVRAVLKAHVGDA